MLGKEAKVKDISKQNCRRCSHWSRQSAGISSICQVGQVPQQENTGNDIVPSDICNLITASPKYPSSRYVQGISPSGRMVVQIASQVPPKKNIHNDESAGTSSTKLGRYLDRKTHNDNVPSDICNRISATLKYPSSRYVPVAGPPGRLVVHIANQITPQENTHNHKSAGASSIKLGKYLHRKTHTMTMCPQTFATEYQPPSNTQAVDMSR